MRSRESVSKVATGASREVNPEFWVDDHGDRLYRYALLRVRRPEVAEDLVQETLYAAVRTFSNFHQLGSLRFRCMGCKVFAFDSTNVRTPFSSI
jgi:hypothetical protein